MDFSSRNEFRFFRLEIFDSFGFFEGIKNFVTLFFLFFSLGSAFLPSRTFFETFLVEIREFQFEERIQIFWTRNIRLARFFFFFFEGIKIFVPFFARAGIFASERINHVEDNFLVLAGNWLNYRCKLCSHYC